MNKEELLYQIATLEQENKQLKEELEEEKRINKCNLEQIDKLEENIDRLENYIMVVIMPNCLKALQII